MRTTAVLGGVLLLALPLAACGAGDDSGGDTTLTVLAAASLTSSFEELERQFEEDHPGVDVRLSFAGSSDLVAQVIDGAAADVLASADAASMDRLVDAGLAAGEPSEFASNTLVIAVPAGNPAGVTGLADLADEDLDVVLCAPEVPCGNATAQVAARSGIELSPDSEEQSVTDVLGKIEAGEGEAGIVYVTDVRAAGDAVEGIDIPGSGEVVNHYPVVVVEGARQPDLANEWIDLLLAEGQAVLGAAGFGPPAP